MTDQKAAYPLGSESQPTRCSCDAGVPSARICGGDATGPDGLCDYCRESEWCVQWRTEQEAKADA